MFGESWFYAGEGELTGIVKGHEAHIQKKGTFKRFGMVDAVLLYWEKLSTDVIDSDPDYYKRAGAMKDMWFFRGGYILKVRKIRKTAHTWLAQKQNEKETDQVPKEALQDADGDTIGTMTYDSYKNIWYKPELLDILKLVKDAGDKESLRGSWPKQADGSLTDGDEADIDELEPLIGRANTRSRAKPM